MKILTDTREQTPLDFEVGTHNITEVKRVALSVGDYMAEFEDGYRPSFSFERKSIGDLFGTMTAGYERFKKEMQRAKEARIKLFLIVEAGLSDVYSGYEHSSWDGESMVKKIYTLRLRYDLETIFCQSRWESKKHIAEFFEAVGREYARAKKLGKVGTAESGTKSVVG